MHDYFFNLHNKPQKIDTGKKIFVAIKKADNDVANMELLSKIMAALKFSLEADCQIFEVEDEVHISNQIKDYQKILIFGIEPAALGLNMNYQPYKINYLEGRTIIFSHALSELKVDDKKKSVLWKALQVMFELVKA